MVDLFQFLVCPLPRTGGFDEKMAKMTICILHTKTRGLAPETPETDEHDESGGCHPGKTTVCQKHRSRHPEYRVILRYYCCDTPLPQNGATPLHSGTSVRTPSCNISRDNFARPIKTSTTEFCDTIATRSTQYEEYRC